MVRWLAMIMAIPCLSIGGFGLAKQYARDAAFVEPLERVARTLLSWIWLDGKIDEMTALVPAAIAVGFGAIFIGYALWPRGGGPADLEKNLAAMDRERERADQRAADENLAGSQVPDRIRRKAEKRAAAMARKGHVALAAELCHESGLPDAAVKYFVEDGDIERAAEIRQDQNRFEEAAELFLQVEQYDAAASLYAARNEYEKAGDCYRKGGRMSVAAEMYEKAGRHLLAGQCFMRCEFHRHAAEAFLKVQDWDRAAKALEKAIAEEAQSGVGDGPAAVELKKLVVQAGRLYDQGGNFEKAAQVLEAGECWEEAGEIAMRHGMHERAARYFQNANDIPRAAEALRAMGEDQAAAQLLGEYHREQGASEEAAELLVQAGDFSSAGDLYRALEDYMQAGECYERGGDAAQAAEMFRLNTAWARAVSNYERIGNYREAADCAAEMGDLPKQAELLTKGESWLAAGRIWLEAKQHDEAIKVLQQAPPDHPDFRRASAILGEIFRAKGQYSLAKKQLTQAIGEHELDSHNIDLFYKLATVCEASGEARAAVEIYERILTADYHYKDVSDRLEVTRSLAAAHPDATGTQTGSLSGSPTSSGRPGRYQIQGELGRGGMGIVYKAQDSVLDRTVALKVLPDALRDSPQALKNFLREAKSAASLNHPNIVTVYDAGEQDGRYYIAMEYVDGTTLKDIVRKRGAIAAKGVVHVLLQMCEALQVAHDQKVVHRDVKTANTMWTRDKKAKIMDFGLAKVVEEVRNHTTLVSGTPYYMSPEQTLGKNVDHRTDIYSLGVTIFELATGTLPFKEGNVPYHHVHTPPPDPRDANPDVPAVLADIINACLQKDPAVRPQQPKDIIAMIRQGLAPS